VSGLAVFDLRVHSARDPYRWFMRRPHGTGQMYESGARGMGVGAADGRRLNRRIGPRRTRGEPDGLTGAQAEQAFRRIQAEEAARRPAEPVVEILTVDLLRERIAIERLGCVWARQPSPSLPSVSR
jgi:hypothetical protein